MTDVKPYRMWYIPQIPGDPFTQEFDTKEQAQDALALVCSFSFFEFQNRIKHDYTDAGGVQGWDADEGEWEDLYTDDEEAW